MRLVLASDHAGVILKTHLHSFLSQNSFPSVQSSRSPHALSQDSFFLDSVVDLGIFGDEAVDYPEMAQYLVQHILTDQADRGILICGTGIGMSMVANRFSGIRAALCHSVQEAQLARAHNNANVLCLGARLIETPVAQEILQAFLDVGFEGGRHQVRLSQFP